jgi:AmmeMemoRadiSam system protein B
MKLLRLFGLTLAISVVVFACARNEKLKITYTYPGDTDMWNHIFKVKEAYKFESSPLGVILPHHLIAADELAKFYTGLSQITQPKLVLVISPNHYENGKADIQTCQNCEFQTTNGPAEVDIKFIDSLIRDGIASFGDETFIKEHGIYNHAPFIKKFFPEAKIVPIVLKWKIPKEKAEALAEWLNKNLPADSLVLTSVDFSHYIPVEAADFHDWSAYATIKNFDYDNVYDLEIDSPSSIYTVLKLMEARGYQKAERFAHTNLQDYVSHRESTTSHHFFGFFKDGIDKVKSITIADLSSLAAANGLSFNKGWNDELGVFRFLKDLKGEEDRFLVGSDFMVFNLEDGKCRKEEQNSMKISFCKFNENENNLAKELEQIKNEKQNADIVYLLYQFKNGSNPNITQQSLAEKFADAGADIFVGKGLANVSPMKIYKKSLIFYSLEELSIGTVVTPESFKVYLFPLETINGYPKLLDFEQRADFFKGFIKNINSTLMNMDAKKMLIEIKR